MLVIRPVRSDDIDALVALAAQVTSFGLTTLPHDADILRRRVRGSEEGFARIAAAEPRGESYLFVMEETETGRVVGTAGIVSKVGGFEPFYAYRIETSIHESTMLGVRKEIATLHLVMEHDGPSEIGSMFLHPEFRARGAGRTLSLSRFLFIAEHPRSFDDVVIAEMRGVVDDRGQSSFWDAVGRHFFEIDYPKADALSIVNKRFIADLMPRHPLSIPLLPPAAQGVIGRVHPETEPALAILEVEGFTFTGMVDIFEAGPIVSCRRDDLRLVRESVRAPVAGIAAAKPEAVHQLVGTTVTAFRACRSPLAVLPDGGVIVPPETAEALGVAPGDMVRYGPLKPTGTRDAVGGRGTRP
jgi:arginine N-succinyltransferase